MLLYINISVPMLNKSTRYEVRGELKEQVKNSGWLYQYDIHKSAYYDIKSTKIMHVKGNDLTGLIEFLR